MRCVDARYKVDDIVQSLGEEQSIIKCNLARPRVGRPYCAMLTTARTTVTIIQRIGVYRGVVSNLVYH